MGILALAVYSPVQWTAIRVPYLQRLLVAAHTRAVSPHPPQNNKVTDKATKDWAVYKHAAIFWALVDGIYNMFFKVCCSFFNFIYDVNNLQNEMLHRHNSDRRAEAKCSFHLSGALLLSFLIVSCWLLF